MLLIRFSPGLYDPFLSFSSDLRVEVIAFTVLCRTDEAAGFDELVCDSEQLLIGLIDELLLLGDRYWGE